MKLILFDIDATLLKCGKQVRPLFTGSLDAIFGAYDGLDDYDFAGKTDPQIVLDLVGAAGIGADVIRPKLGAMRAHYRDRLDAGLDAALMTLLPGVVPLLDRLAARRDVVLGLLTGNWQTCADVKLDRFDLGGYFGFGAFGDDGVQRRELVPVALERAQAATGHRFAPRDALIVGDSIRDVDCARHHGVPCVGVATGFTTQARLRDAGADWVVPDLVDASSSVPVFVS